MVRKYLCYDMARHVDSTLHMFDEWGLPMMKNEKTGRYLREGKWQIMIHGESYKPIVAEAAKKSADKIYNRIMITHLLMDEAQENRIGGAVGFNIRTGDFHVFRAKAVIVAAGGASHIFKPRAVGEGINQYYQESSYNLHLVLAWRSSFGSVENKRGIVTFDTSLHCMLFLFRD